MKEAAAKLITHGASFVKRYMVKTLNKDFFIPEPVPRLSIETTNICDAGCLFCANSAMKRRRQHIEMPIFKKAVDEFAAMGGHLIDFNTVIGEPLLDPSILERARYVRSFRQFESLGFITTLQWLHKFDIDSFFESGINRLKVSAVLSGRERYKEFFGVDRYDIFLKNLLTLIKENNNRKKIIDIYIDIKPTNEHISDIINHHDFKMVNSLLEQDLPASLKISGCYVDDWLGTVRLPSYLKRRPLYPRLFHPCALFYSGLIIYSNGKAGVCACRDFEADSELILGDLTNFTIEELWKGQTLASLRSNWRRRNIIPDICKICRHYVY
ncbi:MAG: radical SAM protein [Candidatus Omnitrophica bacterium]|nr:radical SAM protein [Candidatus Omnitrophota bacterium]